MLSANCCDCPQDNGNDSLNVPKDRLDRQQGYKVAERRYLTAKTMQTLILTKPRKGLKLPFATNCLKNFQGK